MLVFGWLTVLLGVLAVLWADGAFAKRAPLPDAPRALEDALNRGLHLVFPLRRGLRFTVRVLGSLARRQNHARLLAKSPSAATIAPLASWL
jgi:hypothetical protein